MPGYERAFDELCAFVRSNGDIRATPTSLSVPRELREGFYARVGAVQEALGERVLGQRRGMLVALARRCAAVRDGLADAAGLRRFRLASMLEALLADPEREAVRPLFSCVLAGVQDGLSAEALEVRARAVLEPHADLLWRNAYEAWAYYGVVAALRPTRFHAVFSPDFRGVHTVPTEVVEVATQASSPTLRLPEAVFETADGRVFAMKSEAAHELDFYSFRNRRRRDNSAGGNTADLVTHRVLLLWRLAGLNAAGFVADRDKARLVPPDLTVEVLAPAEAATPAYVSAFVERVNAVRSRRPVQVLALGGTAFPEGMLDDPTVAPVQVRPMGEAGGVPGEAETAVRAEGAALLGD